MSVPEKYCLLVVDDEADVCDSIHDLLRRDYVVLKARNADEGYALLQQHEVHIIMTDQRMPKMSGVDLLKKVRVRHPRAVRLLFTGFADLESIIAAINHGHVFQFLKKPWQPEELQCAIREAAEEYDRLAANEEERVQLLNKLHELQERLAALEKEVQLLRQRSA